MTPTAKERDASSWWKVDLAELLSTLCHHCADLAGVVACSIVVKGRLGEIFSAAGSAEWACALDDFQLSEEAGPTWECCTTGRAIRSERLEHRGLTGASLGEPASAHGVVGCRAVPLSSQGETVGALSLYWGPGVRDENILPTGIAVAAIAVRAILSACAQDDDVDVTTTFPLGSLPSGEDEANAPRRCRRRRRARRACGGPRPEGGRPRRPGGGT